MNPWKDETHIAYGNMETPYVRISIMDDNDTVVYRFALEDLNYYYNNHGESYLGDCIEIHAPVINPKDYAALVSKHYNKYMLDIQQVWRSSETGEDKLIKLPSKIFTDMTIDYSNDISDTNPAVWRIKFYNND